MHILTNMQLIVLDEHQASIVKKVGFHCTYCKHFSKSLCIYFIFHFSVSVLAQYVLIFGFSFVQNFERLCITKHQKSGFYFFKFQSSGIES